LRGRDHFGHKETSARGSRHDPPRARGSGNRGREGLTGVVEALGDGGGVAEDAAAEAAGDERRDAPAAHHHHLAFILQAFVGSRGGGLPGSRFGPLGVLL
jgi:hypothetical protein